MVLGRLFRQPSEASLDFSVMTWAWLKLFVGAPSCFHLALAVAFMIMALHVLWSGALLILQLAIWRIVTQEKSIGRHLMVCPAGSMKPDRKACTHLGWSIGSFTEARCELGTWWGYTVYRSGTCLVSTSGRAVQPGSCYDTHVSTFQSVSWS